EAAKTGRKPVDSHVWISVIFNSAKAGTQQLNAAPRLRAVSPVLMDREPKKKIGTVWTTVSLDEKGAPQKFAIEEAALEEYRPDLERTLKAWKFAPAREGGAPVPSEMRVAFLIVAMPSAADLAAALPPRIIRTIKPAYPFEMRRN